jgi:hypothetical protein
MCRWGLGAGIGVGWDGVGRGRVVDGGAGGGGNKPLRELGLESTRRVVSVIFGNNFAR